MLLFSIKGLTAKIYLATPAQWEFVYNRFNFQYSR